MELERAQTSLSEALAVKASDHTVLVTAVCEAERVVKDVLDSLDTVTGGSTCTPDHLQSTSRTALECIDKTASAFSLYSKDPSSELVSH